MKWSYLIEADDKWKRAARTYNSSPSRHNYVQLVKELSRAGKFSVPLGDVTLGEVTDVLTELGVMKETHAEAFANAIKEEDKWFVDTIRYVRGLRRQNRITRDVLMAIGTSRRRTAAYNQRTTELFDEMRSDDEETSNRARGQISNTIHNQRGALRSVDEWPVVQALGTISLHRHINDLKARYKKLLDATEAYYEFLNGMNTSAL